MKQMELSVKQTNFLLKYFWWVGPVYFIGTGVLTHYILDIFGLHDKLSFPLYECPGFFLCFIDHIPIISRATIVFKEPLFILAWAISWIIIIFPPMLIFMTVFDFNFEEKNKSK